MCILSLIIFVHGVNVTELFVFQGMGDQCPIPLAWRAVESCGFSRIVAWSAERTSFRFLGVRPGGASD